MRLNDSSSTETSDTYYAGVKVSRRFLHRNYGGRIYIETTLDVFTSICDR